MDIWDIIQVTYVCPRSDSTLGSGTTAALFGGVLGVAGIFFLSDIPRVRTDIMQKLPFVGGYFVKEIAPEDNPF